MEVKDVEVIHYPLDGLPVDVRLLFKSAK